MREGELHRIPGRAYCLFLAVWRGKPSEITIEMFYTYMLRAHMHRECARLPPNTLFAACQMQLGPPRAGRSPLCCLARTRGVAPVIHRGSEACGERTRA